MDEGRGGTASSAPPRSTPSDAEIGRFRDALAERGDAYRTRTAIELTFVDVLLRMGATEDAASVLDEYQSVLRAYSADVDLLLARSIADGDGDGDGADSTSREPTADVVPEPRVRPLRRALVGALLSAVIAAAVIAPAWRDSDIDGARLASAELEAQEELTVARLRLSALQQAPAAERSVTEEARALHEQILALPDEALGREVVREQIRELLDLERAALEVVADANPEAHDLLDEIRAIRTSLRLDAPAAVLPTPATPTEEPTDPLDELLPAPNLEDPLETGGAEELLPAPRTEVPRTPAATPREEASDLR
jgi:hypothetical protein